MNKKEFQIPQNFKREIPIVQLIRTKKKNKKIKKIKYQNKNPQKIKLKINKSRKKILSKLFEKNLI